jgi:hypothetical protein
MITTFPTFKIVYEALPFALRKAGMIRWLSVLFHGLTALHSELITYVGMKRNRYNWHSGTLALTALLNELTVDGQVGLIIVSNEISAQSLEVWLTTEVGVGSSAPVFLESESGTDAVVYLSTEVGSGIGFTVQIPVAFTGTPELEEVLFRLRETVLAGINYNIIYY